MSDAVDLLIWCEDHRTVDLDRIRAAKASLETSVRCVPQDVWDGRIEGRVLAWRTPPPFVCAYTLVTQDTDLDALADAVAWAMGLIEDDWTMSVQDVLAVIFGPGVREVSAEELESEGRLAEWQNQ